MGNEGVGDGQILRDELPFRLLLHCPCHGPGLHTPRRLLDREQGHIRRGNGATK